MYLFMYFLVFIFDKESSIVNCSQAEQQLSTGSLHLKPVYW